MPPHITQRKASYCSHLWFFSRKSQPWEEFLLDPSVVGRVQTASSSCIAEDIFFPHFECGSINKVLLTGSSCLSGLVISWPKILPMTNPKQAEECSYVRLWWAWPGSLSPQRMTEKVMVPVRTSSKDLYRILPLRCLNFDELQRNTSIAERPWDFCYILVMLCSTVLLGKKKKTLYYSAKEIHKTILY